MCQGSRIRSKLSYEIVKVNKICRKFKLRVLKNNKDYCKDKWELLRMFKNLITT